MYTKNILKYGFANSSCIKNLVCEACMTINYSSSLGKFKGELLWSIIILTPSSQMCLLRPQSEYTNEEIPVIFCTCEHNSICPKPHCASLEAVSICACDYAT
jgi:hypothetical protein